MLNRAQSGLLVPELGLQNTRRNRRWLAIVAVLSKHVTGQEDAEKAAWNVLRAYEETK